MLQEIFVVSPIKNINNHIHTIMEMHLPQETNIIIINYNLKSISNTVQKIIKIIYRKILLKLPAIPPLNLLIILHPKPVNTVKILIKAHNNLII
jgi:hypothetical protein